MPTPPSPVGPTTTTLCRKKSFIFRNVVMEHFTMTLPGIRMLTKSCLDCPPTPLAQPPEGCDWEQDGTGPDGCPKYKLVCDGELIA